MKHIRAIRWKSTPQSQPITPGTIDHDHDNEPFTAVPIRVNPIRIESEPERLALLANSGSGDPLPNSPQPVNANPLAEALDQAQRAANAAVNCVAGPAPCFASLAFAAFVFASWPIKA